MAKKTKYLKPIRKNPSVYEFKVSLLETTPLVWRSFLAHEIIELAELHSLIQMTMGWGAIHFYDFKINGKRFGPTENTGSTKTINDEGLLLCDVLGDTKKFTYTYDHGDNWNHEVEITKVLDHDHRFNYPVCTGGENACPPEDCGGIDSFAELKEVLAGKDCEEKSEILEWVGGFYNPGTFDPNFVNRHFLWNDF